MLNGILGAADLVLSAEELLVVRLACGIEVDEEAPFPSVISPPEPRLLEKGASSLVNRGLADRRRFLPHREVQRRVLVVAQPDARIVLLAARAGQAERLTDAYERAGAYVSYRRHLERHEFGAPLERIDVADELRSRFAPRRASGDFIRLALSPAEYFGFGSFAKTLAHDSAREGGPGTPSGPPSGVLDGTLEGVVLHPRRRGQRKRSSASPESATQPDAESPTLAPDPAQLPVPTEAAWTEALASLQAKSVITKAGEGWELRPYLRDLALGLSTRTRFVMSRFEYGPEEWSVRDVTLVPVPGSLFCLTANPDGGVELEELDAAGLERELDFALGPSGRA